MDFAFVTVVLDYQEGSAVEGFFAVGLEGLQGDGTTIVGAGIEAAAIYREENLIFSPWTEIAILIYHFYSYITEIGAV